MSERTKRLAYRNDENMPVLAVDLLSRIIAVRIDASLPFSAPFTLWLSMTTAVGLASPPSPHDFSRRKHDGYDRTLHH
jgi:hypothetical protein